MTGHDFENLVRSCHAEVFRAAYFMLGEEADAADLVQELYLEVLRGRLSLGDAQRPCAVLRWFAIRRALETRRAARNRRRKEATMSDMNARPNGQPGDELERAENEGLLWEEVMRLPADLRRPLLLRYREDATLAQVGEALGLSLQTVHDRIKRACEKLRPRLAAAGLGGLALPEAISTSTGPVVPAALEKSLLGLGKGLAGLMVLKVAAVLVLVVGAGVGIASFRADDEDALERRLGDVDHLAAAPVAPRREVPVVTPRDEATTDLPAESFLEPEPGDRPRPPRPEAAASAVASGPADQDEKEEGRLHGRVLDQDDRPLSGVLVTASSVERVGKEPLCSRSVRSGPGGYFELALPLGEKGERDFRLWLRLEDHEPLSTSGYHLARAVPVDCGDLRLRSLRQGARPRLGLLIQGPDGEPAEGILVELMLLGEGGFPAPGPRELSDASGRLELEATTHGPHRLRLDGSRRGRGILLADIEIPERGRLERRFVLEAGRELEFRIRSVTEEAPKGLRLHLRDERDPNNWIDCRETEPGRFVARGLGSGPYTAWNADPWWSGFRLGGLVPGSSPIPIVVKRSADPRDHGCHAGEIHFRPVVAETGETIDLGHFSVDLDRVDEGPTATILADQAPWYAPDPYVQRAWFEPEDPGLEEVPEGRGLHHLDGIMPGTWLVTVRPEGRAARVLGPFRVTGTEIFVLERVAFEAPRRVSGRVLDSEGRPVAGALVVTSGSGPYSEGRRRDILGRLDELDLSQRRLVAGSVTTGPDGTFLLEELASDLPVSVFACKKGLGQCLRPLGPGDAELILRLEP
ncbi:MAG: sigma-70 family RNA polymerase sigma factor [Planctomycetes bacterium]|nr:sigma-70 family RNA polymerase sigma factor [Planctomycetota bacterium]